MRRLSIALLALAFPAAAWGGPAAVDWQRKVVRCTGTGAPNLQAAGGNVAVARVGAERAARLDAVRNCMEALKGVNVKTGETVGAAISGNPGLAASVEGVVRGFRQVGAPRYFSDGGVEMDVEVPLEGQLSEVLVPGGGGPAAPPPGGAGEASTGLILDARGLDIAPALAPRILDESGRELYGPATIAAGARQGSGAAYARDLDAARTGLRERVGERPLVVKAVRAAGADAVVRGSDADLLRSGPRFLAEGRVVIVTGERGQTP